MAAAKQKSPHYPTMNLESAIEKARELVDSLGRGPLSREAAMSGMGLSAKSSTGQRTLAALLAFGLWEKAGKGAVRLSERGRRIIAALPDRSMVAQEIGEAALHPRIHRRVLAQWPEGLPAEDDRMLGFLRVEWDFNPDAAAPFIREVRETFSFAKVYETAIMGINLSDDGADDDEEDDEERVQTTERRGALGIPVVAARMASAINAIQPFQPPPAPVDRGGSKTMELTSFPLVGGGRLVVEIPVPTPPGQLMKLATMASTITSSLSAYLEASKPSDETDETPKPT